MGILSNYKLFIVRNVLPLNPPPKGENTNSGEEKQFALISQNVVADLKITT